MPERTQAAGGPGPRLAPRFPAIAFASRMDFENYYRASRPDLDATFLHERRFATSDPCIMAPGTCAPCLRPVTFTSTTDGGDRLPDGTALPNWREAARCDCPDLLNARLRATLHFLQSVSCVSDWTRLVDFGHPTAFGYRLAALTPRFAQIPELVLDRSAYRLPATSGSADVVLAVETLNMVPPLDTALAEIRRVLAPGGQFVFTVPFRLASAGTVSRVADLPRIDGRLPPAWPQEVHELGWDLLDRVRAAGFRRVLAYAYRSEELGYYGLLNMIFSADV